MIPSHGTSTPLRSESIDPAQQPLQMAISAPRLELRLHVPGKIRFGPHEAALEMLHAHDALVVAEALKAARHKDVLVLQVWEPDDDGCVGRCLEAHFPVPGHVLDREHRAVRQEVQVERAVRSVEC